MKKERYYCNCCGHDFTKEVGQKHAMFDDEIICPQCGAYYDENDDSGEVYPFYYNEEDHSLHELETQEEWNMANEVLETFLQEE